MKFPSVLLQFALAPQIFAVLSHSLTSTKPRYSTTNRYLIHYSHLNILGVIKISLLDFVKSSKYLDSKKCKLLYIRLWYSQWKLFLQLRFRSSMKTHFLSVPSNTIFMNQFRSLWYLYNQTITVGWPKTKCKANCLRKLWIVLISIIIIKSFF